MNEYCTDTFSLVVSTFKFIFDIDLCYFDIDRDIDVFPLNMKLLFILLFGLFSFTYINARKERNRKQFF